MASSGASRPTASRARWTRAKAPAAPTEALILLEFGRFLLEQRLYEQAAGLIEASTRHGSGPYGGYLQLAKVYTLSKKLPQAYEAVAKAREFQPNRPAALDLSANLARKLDLLDEALTFAEAHLKLEPESEPSRARLEALRAQLQARPIEGEPATAELLQIVAGGRRKRSRGL